MIHRPDDRPAVENHLRAPDELSRLLANLELTAKMHVAGQFCGPWTVNHDGGRQVPFHVLGSGRAWLHVDGTPPRELASGELVVFTRDQKHLISSSGDAPGSFARPDRAAEAPDVATLICGHFAFGDQRLLLPLLDSLPPVIVLGGGDRPEGRQISRLVSLVLSELADRRPGFHACLDQLGLLLFIETVRETVAERQLGAGLLSGLFDRRIGPVLAAVHAGPGTPWTLDRLAGLAAMSRSSFVERFRRKLGLPPMRYLALWRMSEARRLLRRTDESMAAIAEATGYQSEPAFRKAFRTIVGVPPGRYRARHRDALCARTGPSRHPSGLT